MPGSVVDTLSTFSFSVHRTGFYVTSLINSGKGVHKVKQPAPSYMTPHVKAGVHSVWRSCLYLFRDHQYHLSYGSGTYHSFM